MTEVTQEQLQIWAEIEARRIAHFTKVHTRMTDKLRGRDMTTVMQGPLSMMIKTTLQQLRNRTIGTIFGKPETITVRVDMVNQWIYLIEQLERENRELVNADRGRVRTPAETKLSLIQQLMSKALVFSAKNKATLRFVPLDDLTHVMDHGQLPVDPHDNYAH